MSFAKLLNLKIQNSFYKNATSLCIIIFFFNTLTVAQVSNQPTDLSTIKSDTTNFIKNDSLKNNNNDSLKIATSDLKAEVKYKATDSIVYDAESKQFLLYKNGNILYDDLELNSGFIAYDVDSSTLGAMFTDTIITDSTEKPMFKQGDQTFTFTEMKYNFKSERALVENAKTQYTDGFILSDQVKRNNDKSIYGLTNIYTTCSLDTPHFGIYAKKIKIIPDVVGISGSARLVIENIPTPLILPFGIFPLQKGQHAGFILPQYGFQQNRGFGLTNFGYYQPINDYMDVKFLGDIYSYGSWRVAASSRYIKKYNYTGGLSVSYSKNIVERPQDVFFDESKTYSIVWNHNIDPKKLNGASFNANVNLGSSNSNQFNFNNDINSLLRNQMTSSISYSKTWVGKPYNLTISANHSQNNTSREFNISLPNIVFSASGLTPFAKKEIIGKQKWYEKIRINYNASALNSVKFYDTAFSIKSLSPKNYTNGMKQSLSTAYNTTLLKFFNWNVSGSFNEYWYSKKIFRYYNNQDKRQDTITNYNFYAARDFNAGSSITTNIYGLKTFKKGFLKGIRHHISPSVTYSIRPDFGSPFYNYYYETFLDSNYRLQKLFYYDDGAGLGKPAQGKSGVISFDIGNNLQAKVRDRKDTTGKGVKLIRIFDNFNFNTNYNIAADSNNWAPISASYSTNLFEKLRLNGGFASSLYAYDTTYNRDSKYFIYKETGQLLRFTNASLSISSSFSSKKTSAKDKANTEQVKSINNNFQNYYDFNVPWTIDFSFRMSVNNSYNKRIKKDSLTYSANAMVTGDVNLTENWKINFTSGYNFQTKEITGSEIGITRNLHCWEMSFNLIPFGYGRGYVFILRPKSAMLHDLNVTRRRSFFDN